MDGVFVRLGPAIRFSSELPVVDGKRMAGMSLMRVDSNGYRDRRI